MRESILIIDDNIKLCRSLGRNFDLLGFNQFYFHCGDDAINCIKKEAPDVVLLDVSLGDEDGLNVLKEIKALKPFLPVIMITGFGSIETAVKAIKYGALDFIQKPLKFDELHIVIENALKSRKQLYLLPSQKSLSTQKIITSNKIVLETLEKAKRLAKTDFPILIQGESGTGKEGLAEFIHNNSTRAEKGIKKINCSAFPENLLDNELFGHEKGAYTGATNIFKGVFEKAEGGTLLLDEIGDMSLQTQAKILRTLQNREIKRIGSETTRFIDVRFIASTNKDLKDLIQKGLFREDLYYRLTTATLYLPPLRERREDIPLLAEYFLSENCSHGKKLSMSEEFLQLLEENNWRGNIRELRNIINYAAAIGGDTLLIDDLPPSFNSDTKEINNYSTIKNSERLLILKTLNDTGNNKKLTAEILKISRKTLYNKMERYGL